MISPQTEDKNLAILDSYTEEDLLNAWTDEYGAKYTPDRKKLISAHSVQCKNYTVISGTEIICSNSFNSAPIVQLGIPDSVKYIGEEAFFLSKILRVSIPDSVWQKVAAWLLSLAKRFGNLTVMQLQRASRQLNDVVNGKYDWRISKFMEQHGLSR